MRKILALAMILMTTLLGLPAGVAAQAGASITGQAVDAAGRAIVGERVELLQNGTAVQTTTTGIRGDWSFASVADGEYTVRMSINGQTAGIRVSVAAGQSVTSALIVAPSAAAPSTAFLAALGLLGGALAGAAVAAAIITTAIVVNGS